MTDMYLISGFLGAGKTTLIQKLLTEAFKSKKVALIENDFGDFSVDAALLREGGYQVLALYLLLPHRGFYGGVGLAAENLSPRCGADRTFRSRQTL